MKTARCSVCELFFCVLETGVIRSHTDQDEKLCPGSHASPLMPIGWGWKPRGRKW